jgi:hypothetical protein
MGVFSSILTAGLLLFASFSSSSTYSLKTYGLGAGGTNSAASTTYNAQASAGDVGTGNSSSTTYATHNGPINTEQLNLPPAPTLNTGGGTYYNQMGVTVLTGGNPTDSTYAIAFSPSPYSTTYYVQSNDTLGSSEYYQSYSAWGSGSGTTVIALTPATTYEVSVAAMQGKFTNTNFGSYSTGSTTTPSITFSVSPNTMALGSLTSGTVITSSNITFGLTTNADSGGKVYVQGQYAGLHSALRSYTINAVTGNLSSLGEGFGVQGTVASQTSGGPFTIAAAFNLSANNVAAATTTLQPIFTTSYAVVNGSGTAVLKAKSATSDPPSTDYSETLTFIAAASF